MLLMMWLGACSTPSAPPSGSQSHPTESFRGYWYDGKAEINSYRLSQTRYGENREGSAVLIFVTEDFSRNKQVKLDAPEASGKDKVNVLKLNFTKNFVTGIYPYSLMLSTFTPVDTDNTPHTLKLTMSAQEWCGQVFTQANLKNKSYTFTGHSYFEKEGEQSLYLKAAWLEDELWNRIRLDPETLPVGEAEIIPSLFYSRLQHVGLDIETAVCKKEETGEVIVYSISYPVLSRTLTIEFEKSFPHHILKWQEQFEHQGEIVTTSATLDKTIRTDYWTKNKNEFLYLRDSLGLSRKNF